MAAHLIIQGVVYPGLDESLVNDVGLHDALNVTVDLTPAALATPYIAAILPSPAVGSPHHYGALGGERHGIGTGKPQVSTTVGLGSGIGDASSSSAGVNAKTEDVAMDLSLRA